MRLPGAMRTSQALASSRGAKGEKAIRPSSRILLYRDSVSQDEPDIWGISIYPLEVKSSHLTGFIVTSSAEPCWSHELPKDNLGDEDTVCPNHSLHHQCLDVHILLSASGPLVAISGKCYRMWVCHFGKTWNPKILTSGEEPRNEELMNLLRCSARLL